MSRRGPIIAAIVIVLVAVLAFFFLVRPKMTQVTETREMVDQARADEVALRSELARLEAVREDAPRIRRQLARFRKAVPPVADLPGLINLLQDAANVADVEFFSISPAAPAASPTGAAAEIPASIQVIGSFFQVDEFLFRLETMPRAAKVITIEVAEAGAEEEGVDTGVFRLDVTMSTEFYTTDTAAGPGAPVDAIEAPAATPTPTPSPSPTEEA